MSRQTPAIPAILRLSWSAITGATNALVALLVATDAAIPAGLAFAANLAASRIEQHFSWPGQVEQTLTSRCHILVCEPSADWLGRIVGEDRKGKADSSNGKESKHDGFINNSLTLSA